MIRFFLKSAKDTAVGELVALEKEDLRHAKVLRLREGERVELLNGAGSFLRGVFLKDMEKGGVQIESSGSAPKEIPEIILAVGLTQGGTFETIVRQAVELGVGVVVPLKSDHAGAGVDGKRAASKHERWERIVDEGCKQSGNYWRTRVLPLQRPEEFLKEVAAAPLPGDSAESKSPTADVVHIVAALNEDAAGWRKNDFQGAKKIIVWVGPEGDFSKEEYRLLKGAGARFISLGKTVLRVETACVAAVAGVRTVLQ